MTLFPLPLEQIFGTWGQYIVYLIIGIAFGAVLEMAGFGKSTRLAAQFYFKDLTVLKVMFTGIVVAMLFIFLATGLGLLDFNLIWVNPTYMVPGIVGGLIMGVGFIVGGFCPGTSLVGAVTGKIDAIFFSLGACFGIFVFGESVGGFEQFFNSTYMGRYTLMDMFGTSTGVIVISVVLMAIMAFLFAEQAERIFGKRDLKGEPKWRYGVAGGGVVLAAAVALIGQPTTADKWARLEPDKAKLLIERAVLIDPAELLSLTQNRQVKLVMLDVRSEAEYNLFHIRDAQSLPLERLIEQIETLQQNPSNTVVVVMSNDETRAVEAWKLLVAESVANAYILGGGINNWISTYADAEFLGKYPPINGGNDMLKYRFREALGARYSAAAPNPDHFVIPFEEKVKLSLKRGAKGGCG